MIRGVMMINSSERLHSSKLYWNNCPRMGMSAMIGTRRFKSCVSLVIKPPKTTVSPSLALTTVCAWIELMLGERTTSPSLMETGIPSLIGARLDFSAAMSMTTLPSGLIRGVTPRINPTFSNVMLFC